MNTNHNHRILIVDDSYSMRTLIKKILKDADIDVVGEAKDGEEAIQLAETLRPTIITMDINMPKMNGIEAAKKISELFPLIKIIGVTGVRSADTQQELMSAGAVTIVRKPFQPAFLLGLPAFSELPLQTEESVTQLQPMTIITSEDSSDEDLLGTSDELFIVNEQIERPNPKLLIKNDHSAIEFELESENKEEFSLERNKEKLKEIEIEAEIEDGVTEGTLGLIETRKEEEEVVVEKENEKEEEIEMEVEESVPILTPEELERQKAAMELEESISKLHRVIRPPVQPKNYAASDLTKQSKLDMNEEELEIVLDNRGVNEKTKEYKPSLWSSIKKIFTKN